MRAYMVYSRGAGPQECAVLVFAHTAQEARTVGFHSVLYDMTDGDFTDVAATWLKNHSWLFMEADVEKLRRDIAHFIEDPECCSSCDLWGVSPLDENKHCDQCAREILDQERHDHAV